MRSQKSNCEHSRSWGDSSASPKKSVDWHRTGSSAQDGMGTSDHPLVQGREGRNPIQSTLVLASRRLFSLVLTGAMLVTSAYQVAGDLLCLLVPSVPLVHDLVRLAPAVATLLEHTTELLGTLAKHPEAPLPVVRMDMEPKTLWGSLVLGPSLALTQ